jgi:hypothetical protein
MRINFIFYLLFLKVAIETKKSFYTIWRKKCNEKQTVNWGFIFFG